MISAKNIPKIKSAVFFLRHTVILDNLLKLSTSEKSIFTLWTPHHWTWVIVNQLLNVIHTLCPQKVPPLNNKSKPARSYMRSFKQKNEFLSAFPSDSWASCSLIANPQHSHSLIVVCSNISIVLYANLASILNVKTGHFSTVFALAMACVPLLFTTGAYAMTHSVLAAASKQCYTSSTSARWPSFLVDCRGRFGHLASQDQHTLEE